VSIVPYKVMPFQVSGQFVATKSQRLPHDTGEEVCATAGGAFVAMSSALAAFSGEAKRNAEMPIMQSEVCFTVAHPMAVHR
jgi:hypothetical protein